MYTVQTKRCIYIKRLKPRGTLRSESHKHHLTKNYRRLAVFLQTTELGKIPAS